MTPKQYVQAHLKYALETEKKTGMSAKFTLAQSALETGWGKNTPGNMYFGVKAGKSIPENKRQLLTTTEYFYDDKQGWRFPAVIRIVKDGKRFKYTVKDWFRKYDSPEESFTDHANMMLTNPNFRHALPYISDPYRYADAIQEGKYKYATGPDYSKILKDVIRTVERNM